MKYKFICENGHVTVEDLPIGSIKVTDKKICPECGVEMKQSLHAGFKVPASMSAADSQQIAWVNDIMKNRPSGKRKVLY